MEIWEAIYWGKFGNETYVFGTVNPNVKYLLDVSGDKDGSYIVLNKGFLDKFQKDLENKMSGLKKKSMDK